MKKYSLVLIVLTMIMVCIVSCGINKGQRSQGGDEISIKKTLDYLAKNLDQATFSPIRVGWQFDYGLEDGWILNKFEYIRSLVTYKDFQAMLDYPIYLSGPHTSDELNLSSKFSFGHYNPKFVAQLRKSALLMMSEKEFIANTKPLLENYSVLDFLKRHKKIHEIIQKNPAEFNAIKSKFTKGIKEETWPEGEYRVMIPKSLDSNEYWNWSETSYHFWVRRDIDGTKDLWIGLITDVLNAYNNEI